MSKLSRDIWYEEQLEDKLAKGVEKVYRVAKAAYGPGAGNASLELNFGDPLSSRDGVTNVRKVYLEDAVENMGARYIVQASEKSNKLVGDGTTAVVILSYHLYKEAMKLISAGHNRMVVSRKLKEVAIDVIEQIDAMKKETTPELTRFVAKVSASDEAIGDMIADVMERVGLESNIIVEEFDGIGSYDEEVDGFYFRKGFTNEFLINNLTNLESKIDDADIFITEKTLQTASDIAPILEKIIMAGGKGSDLVIIGEVVDEALATLALNKVNKNIFPTLVDVPVYGPLRSLFLEDIASYTNGTVFPTGANAKSFQVNMLGSAEKVVVNSYSTTIMNGEGAQEDIDMRVADLRTQLEEAESLIDKEEIKKRLSALTGKVAIIKVGAPTQVERGEVQLRVEDAIASTQAAIRDGIVPGGATTLARVRTEAFQDAFEAPFKTLVENAGFNPEGALYALHNSKEWHGFDLRIDADKPVNLLEAGIIDPAEVVKETVRNAISVVSTLVTTSVAITFKDREMKSD